MADEILPADLEYNCAIAELTCRGYQCWHRVVDSKAHGAALCANMGMAVPRCVIERDVSAVVLSMLIPLMLFVIGAVQDYQPDRMVVRGRGATQNAKSAPVENEGDREEVDDQAAQDISHC